MWKVICKNVVELGEMVRHLHCSAVIYVNKSDLSIRTTLKEMKKYCVHTTYVPVS